jgi:hypothetical protein
MVNFDVIFGSAYSCEADKSNLDMMKTALEYHTKNVGNPAKSNITPTDLKKLQLDYDNSKKKYDSSDCGKNPERDTCISLQSQITSMRATISYLYSVKDNEYAIKRTADLDALLKKFDDSKCGAKIGEFRADNIKSITDVYSEMDKKRIEEDSKYQAKQRIFFGALVVLGAVLMVTMFGKKE